MPQLNVHIKHAGKTHDVVLDTDRPPVVFKDAIYQVTGVPPERMKVMIKGGMLKDETDWKKVAPKEGQTFMVIGAAGELPKPPDNPIVFLEDMDESQLAQAVAYPVGLVNLGNTCYMNSTVQALRAIPELQTALAQSPPPGLPTQLSNLYRTMSSTIDGVTPQGFLMALRQAFPQFAEQIPSGNKILGNAEECWVQLLGSLRDVPGIPGPSGGAPGRFVDQYLTGTMRRELTCDEAPEEPPSVTSEKVLKVECNISINTNYMQTGIMDALDGKIEKNSPSLGREAVYTSKSRLSRLPSYLTVHMVRFAWRRDISKKAKIMRKVKFPTEFDALDLVTDDLKEKLIPISRKLKELEKERSERLKVRKRTKVAQASASTDKGKGKDGDVEMADAAEPSTVAGTSSAAAAGPSTVEGEGEKKVESVELEEETVYRERELAELEKLVHPEIKADVGASVSGFYELVAIVTHKGAAADAGHYMGFVKRSVFHPVSRSPTEPGLPEDDEDWYKFDDDKVSILPRGKLMTLDGGGEDSSAYVLLYRTKPLA
ncbi:hypothetical protein EUX98_g5430 [Antrodiella citrinella]|uniref:Ubiquitin carboxyl-terminal hydrolase n=1 Tax=Antrodiella citrinella TaxID=2447956 RepID=A0A4S4MZB6_9APHY|nr:hypothetical protein EUX98_g5430 [Antrodiella citrinella]